MTDIRSGGTVEVEQIAYADVMPRVGELAGELLSHPDDGVRERVEELLDLVDTFHRDGLTSLMEMIVAWRGEIFLESVAGDEITGELLGAYDLAEAAGQNAEDAR